MTLSGRPFEISTAVKKRVKRVMWERVGILRDQDSLRRALLEFDQISRSNLSVFVRKFCDACDACRAGGSLA